MKHCKKCGSYLDESSFYKAKSTKDGLFPVCKDCDRKRVNASYNTPKRRYFILKRSARERGYRMALSFEETMMFWQKPCSYCGEKIETFGIDRVDNTGGYVIGNIVSCCNLCNKMKLAQSKDEFIDRIKRIYQLNCV